ncbi:MAG: PEGA domain-containing protein [Acidobacteriota bacterium]
MIGRLVTPAPQRRSMILFAAVGAVVAFGGWSLSDPEVRARVFAAFGAARAPGTAILDSRPQGATVLIDGAPRGVTPLTLTLPPGDHGLQLQLNGATRDLPLMIKSNRSTAQYVDLPASSFPVAPPMAAATGRIEVTSDPPGAQVTLDGIVRGRTPLVINAVTAGVHAVVISDGGAIVARPVTVTAGANVTVVAAIKSAAAAPTVAAAAPAGGPARALAGTGQVSIDCAIPLGILEGGRMLGLTSDGPLTLTAGRHDLELRNQEFAFQTSVTVDVRNGRTFSATIPLPTGQLSVSALPWAEITVDGTSIGITPLANVPISLGSHQVVFTHPQLGERTRIISVKTGAPTRIGTDFTKPQ